MPTRFLLDKYWKYRLSKKLSNLTVWYCKYWNIAYFANITKWTENPCVTGSIPVEATKQNQGLQKICLSLFLFYLEKYLKNYNLRFSVQRHEFDSRSSNILYHIMCFTIYWQNTPLRYIICKWGNEKNEMW